LTERGLHRVSTPDLGALRSLVERGEARCPLSRAELLACGFAANVDDVLASLGGLDAEASTRMLDALLAERRSRPPPHLDLVWTGPEPRLSTARDTAVLVRQLFAQAERTVLVAGFSFDHGEDIFRPLHGVMQDRGVRCDLFLDIRQRAPRSEAVEAHVRAYIQRFLAMNWPFGPPFPGVYWDPRTAEPLADASLHAKCIVVDDTRTLITSANFTDRGQTRNIELGVLVEDRTFSEACAGQWRRLVAEGLVRRYGP
jgi:PLD-like domain